MLKDCSFDHASYLKLQQENEILNTKQTKHENEIAAAYETRRSRRSIQIKISLSMILKTSLKLQKNQLQL